MRQMPDESNPVHPTPSRGAVAPARDARKGAVLVLVLWILLAMSLLALTFAASIRTEVDAARNLVEQKQAYYLARSGIEYAIHKIRASQSPSRQQLQPSADGNVNNNFSQDPLIELYTEPVRLEVEGGVVEVTITPENGKIDVNTADPNLIFNLLLMIGLNETDAAIISDSIADWRDQDDEVSDAGAELDYYQGLPDPYFPKNGRLDVPEELLLVRGVTPEIYFGINGTTSDGQPARFYGLQDYLTTFGTARAIDVNAAPVQVLAAIPELDYQDAIAIDQMRAEGPIRVGDIQAQLPGITTNVLAFLTDRRTSLVYTLDAVARLSHSGTTNRVRCVVRLAGRGKHNIVYWNEANVEL